MIYTPILIPTLCRYEHFKRCLLSLEKNSLATDTVVYIALDYPLKKEHWDGYKKIEEFLNRKFNFKELIIIKREKNFGAFINHQCALEDLFKEYNAIILSEDDNEFSPNFLEYMNICLEKYEYDDSIIAVGGYSFPIKWKTDGNNIIKHSPFCTAWGIGEWNNRQNWLNNVNSAQLWDKIEPFKNMIKFLLKSPLVFCLAMDNIWHRRILEYDIGYNIYMLLFDKYMIYPIVSKVRNYGCDGSGVNWGEVDNSVEILEIDSATHFEIKDEGSISVKENDVLVNKFFGYSKIVLLKNVIKYFLIKFGFRKI